MCYIRGLYASSVVLWWPSQMMNWHRGPGTGLCPVAEHSFKHRRAEPLSPIALDQMASPPPESVRQWLLTVLTEAPGALTTAELRRCVSTGFGAEVVHERVYHNLEILEKRGEVIRSGMVGRHTTWRLRRRTKEFTAS